MSCTDKLFKSYFKDYLRFDPLMATVIGEHRYDDQLQNIYSDEYQMSLKKHYNDYLCRAQQTTPVNNRELINLEIFIDLLEIKLQGLDLPLNELPLNQMENIFLFLSSLIIEPGFQPLKSEEDLNKLGLRMSHFPDLITSMIEKMQKGIRMARVLPRTITEQVIKQLSDLLKDKPFRVLKNLLDKKLYRLLSKIIHTYFYPQVQRTLDFLEKTYLANSRTTFGYCDMPMGDKMYQYLVKLQTTRNDLSIKAIHKIGLQQTQDILAKIGYLQDMLPNKNFTEDKKFYKKSPQAILKAYEKVRTYINTTILPKYFGKLFPKVDYEIKAVPKFTEEFNSSAYYIPPSIDGNRKGCFFVNMRDPKAHPTYNMEALTLHEGDPGHHYQISLAQENPKVPKFRSFNSDLYNGYIEGWGLYCETLGNYKDGYSQMGQYDYDILRSARLVVDTGIHYYGWSLLRAKKFLRDVSNLTELEVDSEIYRYCSLPGQALSYKIGELTIQKSRDLYLSCKAGNRDQVLISFHQKILGLGPVPLWILDKALMFYDS